jgi:hypothetical protein
MGKASTEASSAPRQAKSPSASVRSTAAGPAVAMLATSQLLGNRGMQALLGARLQPAVSASPVPADAAHAVRAAVTQPGQPLGEGTARRLRGALDASGAPIAPVGPSPNRASNAPLSLTRPDSAHETTVRLRATAHRTAPAPRARPPSRRPRLDAVRIHSDDRAAAAAKAVGARAFALGDDVVFGTDAYAPHTPQGEQLLLHELLHVEHGAASGFTSFGLLIQRDGETHAPAAETTGVTLQATLDRLYFDFGNRRYVAGPTRPQIFPLILRRLVGAQYDAARDEEIFARWQARVAQGGTSLINDLDLGRTARVGRTIGVKNLHNTGALLLIEVLENDFDLRVDISAEFRELLRVGFALEAAWPLVRPRVSPWYTEFMFRREMSSRAAMARDWQRMAPTTPGSDAYTDENRGLLIDAIVGDLIGPIRTVEAIRVDFALANADVGSDARGLEREHQVQAAAAYRLLWNIGPPHRRLTAAPPDTAANVGFALGLLGYIHTQPAMAAAAGEPGAVGHGGRFELLGRYQRFAGRVGRSMGLGERLFSQPARATDRPWDATLSSTPPLAPPLFDAALETDHQFTMQLAFGDVFDAFGIYNYLWKFVRIPEPESGDAVPDPLTAAGTRPTFGAVWDTRLSRSRRYNATDLERIRQRFGDSPWGRAVGAAAIDLVRLNNALRTLGTVIRTVLNRLTQPRNTTPMVFPGPGMYIVVCRAVPVLDGDEEVTHAPSVAMLPVVARDPDEMAVSRVQATSRNEFQARLRLAELQALLQSPIPPENPADLRAEMEQLQSMLAEPEAALASRGRMLDGQIALLERRRALREQIATAEAAAAPDTTRIADLRRQLTEAGGAGTSGFLEERELRELRTQRETVSEMVEMREARASGETGALFVPQAMFVSDLGASMALTLEMYDRGAVGDEYQVFISDLTTPDSGQALGTADVTQDRDPRVTAVTRGVKELLETSSDYGRGRVAIQIEGVIHTVRIDAGTGRMLMEGIENGVTVLSLAAILAAPLTGGESLILLLPLGAVGAIPSAYRLYQRHDEHRLRFDLASVMDVVNVVGGVIGLAHAATPLRMVRLGRVLMVAGLGSDGAGMLLMGAALTEQILALQNLPEHERAARLLEILGGAMLQIGIQAGGMLAHSRYQGRREGAAHAGDETPGFRPPSDADIAALPPPRPADRRVAGSGPPPPPPPRRTAPARRPPPHERLLDRLAGGIDYSRPAPAANPASPPPAGQFGRGQRNPQRAYARYNDAVAASGGREVGLFHNPRTGEYRVMIGDETGVNAPARGGWDAVVHYHPSGSTHTVFRLPSPHDFQGLMFRVLESGAAAREFVEFDIPGVGRGRTEYGIDPANPEPFYVRIHRPNDAPQTLRFAHDGSYRGYWGERTVYAEPGSPLYDAMIRDIQAYVRSLDRQQAGAVTRPHDADPTAPPVRTPDRAVAGSGSTSPFLDAGGGLSDAGVAFIRRRFPEVPEFGARGRRARRISLENLTDAEIRQRFPTESTWLEAVVVGEVQASWIGRTTTTDFLLDNPRQTLAQVARRLATAVEAGGTGHTVDAAVLNTRVLDFLRERLAANDPTLRPAWDALENSPNPVLRAEWNEFLFGRRRIPDAERQALLAAPPEAGQGFAAGRIGGKQPDVIEVLLSQDTLHVLDPSQRWSNQVHNFKTAFYEAVLRHLIDVGTVTSTDTGGGARIRPTGQ